MVGDDNNDVVDSLTEWELQLKVDLSSRKSCQL